ncbi:MAG: hypothetical protein AAB413_05075 [Patescibacteria group bacterium]|mgnify:CR=1 FL=1
MSEKHEPGFQPGAHIEEEAPYKMNLLTNRDAVIEALIAMEGQNWFENHQPRWGENSIDGALKKVQDGGSGIIYGAGGSHRFYIRKNGDVVYSGSHGANKVDKAQSLGFKIN